MSVITAKTGVLRDGESQYLIEVCGYIWHTSSKMLTVDNVIDIEYGGWQIQSCVLG